MPNYDYLLAFPKHKNWSTKSTQKSSVPIQICVQQELVICQEDDFRWNSKIFVFSFFMTDVLINLIRTIHAMLTIFIQQPMFVNGASYPVHTPKESQDTINLYKIICCLMLVFRCNQASTTSNYILLWTVFWKHCHDVYANVHYIGLFELFLQTAALYNWYCF